MVDNIYIKKAWREIGLRWKEKKCQIPIWTLEAHIICKKKTWPPAAL